MLAKALITVRASAIHALLHLAFYNRSLPRIVGKLKDGSSARLDGTAMEQTHPQGCAAETLALKKWTKEKRSREPCAGPEGCDFFTVLFLIRRNVTQLAGIICVAPHPPCGRMYTDFSQGGNRGQVSDFVISRQDR